MDKHSKLRELTSFQYWLGTNYSNLPTNSTHMTERARLYLKEQSKEWEILEFKYADGSFFKLKDNGLYSMHDTFEYSLDHMLNRVGINYNIHKVKRLSDGEIFEVGDETDMGPIESFKIEGHDIYAETNCFNDVNFRLLKKEETECGFTRDLYELQDALKGNRINTGWQCPKCKTIWNPDTDKCKTCLTEK